MYKHLSLVQEIFLNVSQELLEEPLLSEEELRKVERVGG
jgi:hypothetical protein